MPTSSSTIRISLAVRHERPYHGCRRGVAPAHAGNASVTRAPPRRDVLERDAAAVLVDDFLHDREPQARCLSPWSSRTARTRARARPPGSPGPSSANASVASPPRAASAIVDTRLGDVGLGVDRVLKEIVEHLAQAGGLALDDDGRVGQAKARRAGRRLSYRASTSSKRAREIDRLHLARARLPRVDREVVDHVLHRRHLRR